MLKIEAEKERPHMAALGFDRSGPHIGGPAYYWFLYSKQVGEYTLHVEHEYRAEHIKIYVDGYVDSKHLLRLPESRLDDVEYISKLLSDYLGWMKEWMTKQQRAERDKRVRRITRRPNWFERLFLIKTM